METQVICARDAKISRPLQAQFVSRPQIRGPFQNAISIFPIPVGNGILK